MHTSDTWSLNLGRLGPIRFRVHLLFVIFGVLTMYMSWLAASAANDAQLVWLGAMSLIVLAASAVIHELGHAVAALRLEEKAAGSVVISPWGGIAPPPLVLHARHDLMVAAAGPLTSLALCVFAAVTLAVSGEPRVWAYLNPLQPGDLTGGTVAGDQGLSAVAVWHLWLKFFVWVNWMLTVVNLIPAPPFDGGRILSSLMLLVREDLTYQRAHMLACRTAEILAAGILVSAWFLRDWVFTPWLPAWLPLSFLAVIVYFAARYGRRHTPEFFERFHRPPGRQEPEESAADLETLLGMESDDAEYLPEKLPAPHGDFDDGEYHYGDFGALKDDDEAKVDEVLARLHQVGLDGLSQDERSLLHRMSAKYRSRLRG